MYLTNFYLLEFLHNHVLHAPYLQDVSVSLLEFFRGKRPLSHDHSDLRRFLLLFELVVHVDCLNECRNELL